MAKGKTEKIVFDLVNDLIKDTALELVDVEYVKERDWYLRVFLDKDGGLDVDDCQWVSERLEKQLDQIDLIRESYYLEVSSPGLDRALHDDRDFLRYTGKKLDVNLYAPLNNTKAVVGVLKGLNDGGDLIMEVDGAELTIARTNVSLARLHLDF